MKKQIAPEDIFLNEIKTLIRNLLIDNPNYKNHYYSYDYTGLSLMITDTKDRANYILERIEHIEHLIKDEDNV